MQKKGSQIDNYKKTAPIPIVYPRVSPFTVATREFNGLADGDTEKRGERHNFLSLTTDETTLPVLPRLFAVPRQVHSSLVLLVYSF